MLRIGWTRLQNKLTLSLAVLLMTIVACSAYFAIQRERDRSLLQLEQRATRLAELLSSSLAEPLWNVNVKAMNDQLTALAVDPEVAEVAVTAVNYGRVAMRSGAGGASTVDRIQRSQAIKYTALTGQEEMIGEVQVVLSRAVADATIARFSRDVLIAAGAGVTVLCGAAFILLRRMVGSPINRLERMVDRIAGGDLTARCPIESRDELGRLAARFNTMADRIEERETKIRRLVDANIIGIFTWHIPRGGPESNEGFFVEVNDAFLQMLGYDRDDLVSGRMRRSDLTPAEWRDRDMRTVAELREQGVAQPFEKEFFRKDGSRIPVLMGGACFDDTRTHGVAFVVDLTARKRAENELRENEAKLVRAQRIAHFGWWERDFTTNRVSLSDEACRIFGVEPVELPDWHGRWLNLIHPEDRPKAAEAATAALLRGGPRYDVEYRVVRPDSTERIVHSQGDVTWDDSGRPLRQFGVMQDITELRKVEQELRASEARFRTFVDHATDAFLLLDDDWTVLDVNRQACDGLGYSRDELIGRPKSDLDVGLEDTSIQRLKQRMIAGEAITFETRHQRKNGTSFPVEVRVGQFEQGGPRYLCLVRDITERKRAEDELRASEERFRTLVQFSFDVYWESNAQHRFTRQEFAEGLDDAPPPGSEIGKTRWELPYLEPDAEAWRKHRETLDAHLPFRDFELARPTPQRQALCVGLWAAGL